MNFLGKKLELIYKLRGERVAPAINKLQALEDADNQTVLAYKEKKLWELLHYVSENCKYYQSAIENIKASSSTASAFDILYELPVTDKWVIKNKMADFLGANERGLWRSTSGTTGTPFVFKKDKHASAYMDAMMYSVYDWHGIKPTSRQARIWGSAVGLKRKVIQQTKDWLLGRKRLSAFEMDDLHCRRFFYQLVKHRPLYFYCYPNAMYQFVLSMERQGLDGQKIGASIVICTGEVLFPHVQDKIEQMTGCRVVSEYGSTENGILAFECKYGNMHVLPTVHVDVIDPDREGFGELAVTELNSRSVPFIKYKTGDMGRVLNPGCNCGRPFQILEIQDGRANDLIVCPDGKKVYAAILAYVLKDHVLQFRAYQDKRELINIDIIPKGKFDTGIEQKVKTRLRKYLNNEMQVNFKVVDKILPDKSGKLRYFISRIK